MPFNASAANTNGRFCNRPTGRNIQGISLVGVELSALEFTLSSNDVPYAAAQWSATVLLKQKSVIGGVVFGNKGSYNGY